jgi:predicted phage-related endonuclease
VVEPGADERKRLWLEDRRTAITATDGAKIMGLSTFGGPMSVWLDKTGKAPLQGADTDALRFGRRFERPILEEYADRERVAIIFADPYRLVRSATHPRIGATLDAMRDDTMAPVDAKNVGFHYSAKWGPDGSDIFPSHYAVQLLMQLFVLHTGNPQMKPDGAHLAVLFNRYDFCVYPLPYDAPTALGIVERCVDFWERHVVPDQPPPPDASEEYSSWIKATVRQTRDAVVSATPQLHEQAMQLAVTRAQLKELEALRVESENVIKLAIGENRSMQGPTWKATWATTKDTEVVDYESIATALANHLAMLETTLRSPGSGFKALEIAGTIRELLTNVRPEHTRTKPGYRRFTFTTQEDASNG